MPNVFSSARLSEALPYLYGGAELVDSLEEMSPANLETTIDVGS